VAFETAFDEHRPHVLPEELEPFPHALGMIRGDLGFFLGEGGRDISARDGDGELKKATPGATALHEETRMGIVASLGKLASSRKA
jgi:hypothetical protein